MKKVKQQKVGRKRLPTNEKRDYTVSVRLSDVERERLERERGSMQRGTFLRNCWLGVRPVPAVNRELWVELSRVGSNLNQIAHKLNISESVEMAEALHALSEFRSVLIAGGKK